MITILDGGMGRELEQTGAPFRQPEWSALALMETPDKVRAAHDRFVAAGSDVITTNSYACVPFHIGAERFAAKGRALIGLAARLARDAADAAPSPVNVAGAIPPLFGSYNPDLFDAARAPDILMPLIEEQAPFVDLWLIETVSSVEEGAFVTKALQQTGKPIWLSFTLEDNRADGATVLRDGQALTDALAAIKDLPLAAVLFNCSKPETITPAIAITKEALGDHVAIGAYANAFADEIETGHGSNEVVSPLRPELTDNTEPYLELAKQWIADGATIIGGCCGIRPNHIAALTALK